ncbi:MAG: efflux RND transporter periplasmic adaptor subunit [Bryobacterales bacterium]|nr:efflux RND transporter periplasmic adaptor subunit [Bryobacterales bacterium]
MTKVRLAAVVLVAFATGIAGGVAIWDLDLIGVKQFSSEPAATPQESDGLYTCGMHPEVIREGRGQCPICGMDLTPIETSAAHSEKVETGGVRVSKNFLQNFAVRIAEVERNDLPARIRTVGYLDQDEEKLVSVNTKFGGWIEKSRVNTIGERVEEGDVLFEIYSPELVTAQEEYLSAMEYASRLRTGGAYSDAVDRAESLFASAAERLRHWDLTSHQIEQLAAVKRASRTLEIYSPASGYVVEKLADSLEGLRAVPGVTLLKIADHSTLWAKVEFYEHYLQDLRSGLSAEITLDAFPGRRWRGEVLFFQPAMNPQTQTLTGYIEVENSDGRLRPKMYATIEIELPGARDALIVPAQSVLHAGDHRDIVIVDGGDGLFFPREVEVGIESDRRLEIVAGLSEGERVVISSQFLLDSESNLQAAVERFVEGSGGAHQHAY